jgi:hypothetical protein
LRAEQAKGRFLATASHDLRQPLQAVSLLNGALRRVAKDPTMADALGQQDEAIGTASRLLNALLDISKLESGVIEPEPAVVSVADLLTALEREFRGVAATKGLELRVVRAHRPGAPATLVHGAQPKALTLPYAGDVADISLTIWVPVPCCWSTAICVRRLTRAIPASTQPVRNRIATLPTCSHSRSGSWGIRTFSLGIDGSADQVSAIKLEAAPPDTNLCVP